MKLVIVTVMDPAGSPVGVATGVPAGSMTVTKLGDTTHSMTMMPAEISQGPQRL